MPQQIQLIDHWIIKHGGDCCGCAVSEPDGNILCNECGETLDVLVSEVAFQRMAEALQRAHHALASSSGLQTHDGKPEHAFTLDHRQELRFIEEALVLADVESRPLKPLGATIPVASSRGIHHDLNSAAQLALALFAKANQFGSDMVLASPDHPKGTPLGMVDSYLVLRSTPEAFWVMFKMVYFEQGQQYTHTIKVVDARMLAPGALLLTDDEQRTFLIGPTETEDEWQEWLRYRAEHGNLAADAESLLETHTHVAFNWKDPE